MGGFFGRVGKFVTRWPLLVIAIWLAVPTALFFAYPPLSQAIEDHPVPLVPAGAPSMVTEQQMVDSFHEADGENLLLVVLTDDRGLTAADEHTYTAIVSALHADTDDVKMLQEFVGTPALRDTVTSKDHKAWVLPVGLAGSLDTPQGHDAYLRVSDMVKHLAAGSSLKADLTGPSATISDLVDVNDRDSLPVEIATVVLVLGILILVYRNVRTMMVPLVTIGLSLMTARGVVAGLSTIGLGVSNESVIMMTAIVAGAGTDYAVFLISRYHEELRHNETAGTAIGQSSPMEPAPSPLHSDTAVAAALAKIGKVIAASGATVAITFMCMAFAKLGLLSTIGPALSISVVVCVLAAFTLLPAILVLAGRRGWVNPRRELGVKFWHGLGVQLVRHPGVYLSASLVVLTVLATCGLFAQYNWDESKTMPQSEPSNRGYTALSAHFPLNATIPQYLVIHSPQDLRTSRALADLEQMAYRISQLPNITAIRGITRPNGEPPVEATVSYQAGEVGAQLKTAADSIRNGKGELDQLVAGSQELAATLAQVHAEVSTAVAGGGGSVAAVAEAGSLLRGLNSSGLLDELDQATQRLPQTEDTREIISAVRSVHSELSSAAGQLASMGLNNAGATHSQLAMLQSGAAQLADGGRQLSDGVTKLADSTNKIMAGLQEASDLLRSLKHDTAGAPAMSGFFVTPEALVNTDLRKAAEIFVSPDGHTVRYLIQTSLNPFGTGAMDQVNEITRVAQRAQPNTELADASVSMGGFPAVNRDLRDYYDHDLKLIIAATLIVVFLILVVLLRAIVAPLHLIVSVVISYLSALGVGVIVFQVIGGQQLSWSVSGMAFIVLVAVGADYNMLLISRVRDESPHNVSDGVIKTVTTTGGVITSAGLIFAASMFGLMFGSIDSMTQAGCIIGVGLLIDTFLVRTVTVPALAVLIGRNNWWPTLWGRKAIPLMSKAGGPFSMADEIRAAVATGESHSNIAQRFEVSLGAVGCISKLDQPVLNLMSVSDCKSQRTSV